MKKEFDVVVIGAGSGGLTAAVGFSRVGKKVLLIEREHMGGECTNTGCVPSKALLHRAKEYRKAIELAGHTDQTHEYRRNSMRYVREIIDGILAHETPETFEKMGITVVMGEAEFGGKCFVKVGDTEYHYKHAVIATGSSPRIVDIPGLDQTDVLTNQNIFTLEEIPKHTLIIGSGPIGLEMGQALAMLGSQVTIASIDTEFGRLEDPAIRPKLLKTFTDLGVTIELNAFVKEVNGKEAIFDIKNGEEVIDQKRIGFDKVLVAIGRVPNLPKGLESAEIKFSKYGVEVDNQYRTSNKYVYALGDVSQRLKFTHTADDTARQVVAHVASKGLLRVNNQKAVPKVTYTSPEVAQVGMSWEEAKEKYGDERVMRIEVPFTDNDRAKTDDATDGLLVVVARRLHGSVLGAHLIGPSAGELLTPFVLAIDQKIPMWKLQSTIFAYPTYSLVIKKAGDYFVGQQFADLKKDVFSSLKRHAPQVIAALLWLTGLFFLTRYQQQNDLSVLDTSLILFDFITGTIWGPLLYILAYTFRPLTLLPGTLMTVLSGVFFGLWYGIIYTVIGANLSAALAYVVGRFFGGSLRLEDTVLGNWVSKFRAEPFTTTLVGRLIFLPFDVVNYACGILCLPFWAYVTATFIGTLLGIATFVSVGASLNIDELRMEGLTADVINLEFIGLSVLIFVVSIGISKVLKRWKKAK